MPATEGVLSCRGLSRDTLQSSSGRPVPSGGPKRNLNIHLLSSCLRTEIAALKVAWSLCSPLETQRVKVMVPIVRLSPWPSVSCLLTPHYSPQGSVVPACVSFSSSGQRCKQKHLLHRIASVKKAQHVAEMPTIMVPWDTIERFSSPSLWKPRTLLGSFLPLVPALLQVSEVAWERHAEATETRAGLPSKRAPHSLE